MAASARGSDELVIAHPNREKAGSQGTKRVVTALLAGSAALLVVLSYGGWERIAGAKPLQVAYVLVYVVIAWFVARWSRGVLPLAAALATILFVFAAVSAPGWYARADDGFAATNLPAELLGHLCVVLAIAQVALVAFAQHGFRQAWNVEVERSPHAHGAGGGDRSGAVTA